MSLDIRFCRQDGATVVTLGGTAGATLLEPMRDALGAMLDDEDLLVVDLDELDVAEADGLPSLLAPLLDRAPPGNVRLAAQRRRAVDLVARGRLARIVPVHATVEAAIQAHTATGS